MQAEKHKSLKLTAGLIRFSTFTDRVVPLNVFKMILRGVVFIADIRIPSSSQQGQKAQDA